MCRANGGKGWINTLSWKTVSKYRGELFGLAILSVVLLHFFGGLERDSTNSVFYFISKIYTGVIGSVGVDIFVFLSGFGLYYSLANDNNALRFYSKRIWRVLFPYIVLGVVFWIIKDVLLVRKTFLGYIYDFSLLSFWGSGVQTFWYIAFISLMYLLAPLIFKVQRRPWLLWVCVFAACILNAAFYFGSPARFNLVEIAVQRVPVFLVGMYCGSLSKAERQITMPVMVLLAASVPLKIVLGAVEFPLARMFNGYYAIFLVVAYSFIRTQFIRGETMFFKVLTRIGSYSLELYISHISIRNIMTSWGVNLQNAFNYLLHIIIFIPIALLLSRIQKLRIKNRG